MEIIKNKRVLALVGVICLILGTFFPYITVSFFGLSESLSLFGYWEGKIVLVLALANALIIFRDFIKQYIPQLFNNKVGELVEKFSNPKFSLVPTILIAVFAIYMLTQVEVDSQYIKYGLGFWTLWIGVIALVGHALFYKGAALTQFTESNVSVSSQPVQPIQPTQPVQPTQPMESVQTQTDIPTPSVKYCSHCGGQVDINAETCFMCGNKLN